MRLSRPLNDDEVFDKENGAGPNRSSSENWTKAVVDAPELVSEAVPQRTCASDCAAWRRRVATSVPACRATVQASAARKSWSASKPNWTRCGAWAGFIIVGDGSSPVATGREDGLKPILPAPSTAAHRAGDIPSTLSPQSDSQSSYTVNPH